MIADPLCDAFVCNCVKVIHYKEKMHFVVRYLLALKFICLCVLNTADSRHGTVSLDGESLSAKLVDLPCIIESLKTLDMKNFYKTADISQVLCF